MNRMSRTLLLIVAAILLAVAPSLAQTDPQARGGRWGGGGLYNRMYNPATVETLRGEVANVRKIPSPQGGMAFGVHLDLRTDKETITVHVGPGWFLQQLTPTFKVGDEVSIKGSRITLEGREAIIAAEIERQGQVLRLREPDGFPVWGGWRRRM